MIYNLQFEIIYDEEITLSDLVEISNIGKVS